MATKNDRSVTPTPRTAMTEVSVEAINQRAYQLFEARAAAARPDRRLKTGSRQNASCTQDDASSNVARRLTVIPLGVGRRLGGSHSAH